MARDRTAPLVTKGQEAMMSRSQPIACTLAPEELRHRRAWIADLSRNALKDHRRDDLVLHLRYLPDAADRVREMVRMERQCCAFLTFETRERPDEVLLTITAPEPAREIAAAMFDQFVALTRAAATCGCSSDKST